MIGIVTDSTCDLPPEVAQEAGIHVVPAYLNLGQDSLRDGIDIQRDSFYAALPAMKELPQTASPAPGIFADLYENLLSRADHVISLHVASQLSSICSSAATAAAQVDSHRITTIDSGQVSMGLGWAALAGARAAASGASREGVIHSIRDTLGRSRVYAVLDTLKYLARSGRVDLVRMGLSSLLSIKPMIEIRSGLVIPVGRIRTWSKATAALADSVCALEPLSCLAVMHTNIEHIAVDFQQHLRYRLSGSMETLIASATTVIGAHTGPGALGVAVVTAG